MEFPVKEYIYNNRIYNLSAEAVGVVSGEKHFPVFEGNQIFKPLSKSKPFTTPMYAYAEVFWSQVINRYFMAAPVYQLAFCRGYEAEQAKYYDYGTTVPVIYDEGQKLKNLLEFFRSNPDKNVDIDNYINYCMMFYDYTDIFMSDFFKEHESIACDLARHVLVSVLKGDQNYHYENVAFICDEDDRIIRLAPMIDHEFSTYFMFPDNLKEHFYWLNELEKSISGENVSEENYDKYKKPEEKQLAIKSATALNKNLVYIKEYFPEVVNEFVGNMKSLKADLESKPESFYINENSAYPKVANSFMYIVGKARFKDKDESKAKEYEKIYCNMDERIDFEFISKLIVAEIKKNINLIAEVLS